MRAPDAVVANRRSARAARDKATIRPPDARVNIVVSRHQDGHHRVVANTCRAEASSMPAGPATGRVEAKRRALTTPSTAPASSARSRQGSIQVHDFILFPPKKGAHSQTDCDARRQPTSAVASMHEQMHAGGAISPARTGLADSDTRHDERWRERPRQGALGSGAGHGGGVVHAIVGAVTSARALLHAAAKSAASWSWPRQRTSLQAFACGSCSWPTKGERASGEVVETGGPT
jgi:hypothetical protein